MNPSAPFRPTITNEETTQLPAARFPGTICVVETEQQCKEACSHLAAQQLIGFDTETRPSFRVGVTNRVALLQLSTDERCFLFRLNKIPLQGCLVRLLENKAVLKIGADVAGDLRSLHELRRFRERGFVDLQSLSSEWGVQERSLRKMSAIVLGERVSKAQRLSNWAAAQLTDKQQMYAATDAWICIRIYRRLLATPKPQPLIRNLRSNDTPSLSATR